ncbi:hypothetical protein BCLUESOX_1031 [bacterium endosymbiont of Bathymodiolus sp. 5 South]|nr:hypothetical protein [uncultured Gammaproteobacteria bacterium]CAC9657281.1 hypothetical protein [uncultured Gammaproteobacteria bacterium]SHN90804.1 hypothetical protein BCLUESOX_1031 [bacterium endosymbiont of Bathymodiolus sp. 5 South]VVH59835.1 hypothetical protein BSPCLSOX_2083 [uncultured Gammaproteobacteria bacterium]
MSEYLAMVSFELMEDFGSIVNMDTMTPNNLEVFKK